MSCHFGRRMDRISRKYRGCRSDPRHRHRGRVTIAVSAGVMPVTAQQAEACARHAYSCTLQCCRPRNDGASPACARHLSAQGGRFSPVAGVATRLAATCLPGRGVEPDRATVSDPASPHFCHIRVRIDVTCPAVTTPVLSGRQRRHDRTQQVVGRQQFRIEGRVVRPLPPPAP